MIIDSKVFELPVVIDPLPARLLNVRVLPRRAESVWADGGAVPASSRLVTLVLQSRLAKADLVGNEPVAVAFVEEFHAWIFNKVFSNISGFNA